MRIFPQAQVFDYLPSRCWCFQPGRVCVLGCGEGTLEGAALLREPDHWCWLQKCSTSSCFLLFLCIVRAAEMYSLSFLLQRLLLCLSIPMDSHSGVAKISSSARRFWSWGLLPQQKTNTVECLCSSVCTQAHAPCVGTWGSLPSFTEFTL